jgi:hypothetical protein
VMTDYSARGRDMSCPIPSHTAARSSEFAGSAEALNRETCDRAIPSARIIEAS